MGLGQFHVSSAEAGSPSPEAVVPLGSAARDAAGHLVPRGRDKQIIRVIFAIWDGSLVNMQQETCTGASGSSQHKAYAASVLMCLSLCAFACDTAW
eukprot:5921195-Amphidinium_carterae.1